MSRKRYQRPFRSNASPVPGAGKSSRRTVPHPNSIAARKLAGNTDWTKVTAHELPSARKLNHRQVLGSQGQEPPR